MTSIVTCNRDILRCILLYVQTPSFIVHFRYGRLIYCLLLVYIGIVDTRTQDTNLVVDLRIEMRNVSEKLLEINAS